MVQMSCSAMFKHSDQTVGSDKAVALGLSQVSSLYVSGKAAPFLLKCVCWASRRIPAGS